MAATLSKPFVVPAGSYTDFQLPVSSYGAGIQVVPGAAGSANVQFSLSPWDGKNENSLQNWTGQINDGSTVYGSVTELASGAFNAHVQWIRMSASGQAATFYLTLQRK